MNKHESKYFNTAILMDEALINLLNKKNIEYISIKEICDAAGVNRSTFYLHYESINDLVNETMDYINKKFINCFNESSQDIIYKINNSNLQDLNLVNHEYLYPYLNFIKNNKKIYEASFNNPKGMYSFDRYNYLKKYILIPILKRFNVSDKEIEYRVEFYINGIASIIKKWLSNDCEESVLDIEKIIIKCVGIEYVSKD